MKLRQDSDPVETAARLRRRTYSPLCGLVTSVGYSLHPALGPRVRVNGGELTGMHALLDRPDPKPGSYHIGGVGLNEFEAEIKVYAEAVERYCAGTGILHSPFERRWATRQELLARTEDEVLDLGAFGFAQRVAGGAFDTYRDDLPMTWVKTPRVGTSRQEWIPAQFFYLGYNPRRHDGEPWLGTAVTTGTAVHTSRVAATLSAAYELIQVDAAMGLWYGASSPVRIRVEGPRLQRIQRLVERAAGRSHELRFYWLPTPGLKHFTVACMMVGSGNQLPLVAVGLSADAGLEAAMYKAFLECSGVRMLAVWTSFDAEADASSMSTEDMLDLDSNVSYYARNYQAAQSVVAKFDAGTIAQAEDLPPDDTHTGAELVKSVVNSITCVSPLYIEDFTTIEIQGLGLHCVRLWAPGLLALSLPSAPMRAHPRYAAYGGFQNPQPHPYP